MSDVLCVVCRHRKTTNGHVCNADRSKMADQLADLLTKMHQVRLQLVPVPPVPSDRVSTSRVDAPMPARLEVLSLTGPGALPITGMMHPLIRRWSTERVINVTTTVGGENRPDRNQILNWKTTTVRRHVTEWHQELALDADGKPIMVAPDDQIGSLPPAEWLAAWSRNWRERFGHHTPEPKAYSHSWDKSRGATMLAALNGGVPNATEGKAQAAVADLYRKYAPDHSMPTLPGDDDPLANEWETRFGQPHPHSAPAEHVRYLLAWLDEACDTHSAIEEFAAGLRSLIGELEHVLGEKPSLQWIGRCPAQISDAEDEPTRPCGVGLWQDPHADAIKCPRCQSGWGPSVLNRMQLAREIRLTWPIDRRRRYNADEITDLAEPAHGQLAVWPDCPGCLSPVRITWKEVTSTLDKRRWWRPTASHCPNGCPDAERTI